jgi:hypothetical protein
VLHHETVDKMTGGYERRRAKVVNGAGVIESKGYSRYWSWGCGDAGSDQMKFVGCCVVLSGPSETL